MREIAGNKRVTTPGLVWSGLGANVNIYGVRYYVRGQHMFS